MTQPDPASADVDETAIAVSAFLIRLDPGPLAELRRMTADRPAAAFWRLVARYPRLAANETAWANIVRILALLAPKGEPKGRPGRMHNAGRPLGAVLCDGGDPGWPGGETPRPVLSELRLMRLLASRGAERSEALARAVRSLARTIDLSERGGVHVGQIAWACLAPARTNVVARSYYDRLDRAQQTQTEGEPQ